VRATKTSANTVIGPFSQSSSTASRKHACNLTDSPASSSAFVSAPYEFYAGNLEGGDERLKGAG
jgi:hypothetical protein